MLNDSIDNIRLDINNEKVKACIYVQQSDTKARTLHCTLVNSGKVVSLENAILAELLIKKPDGTETDQGVVVVGDELQYTLRTQDISAEGECKAQYMVTFEDGTVLTSPKFSIFVYKKVLNQDSQLSMNEYTAITEQLVEATQIKENCEYILGKTIEAKDYCVGIEASANNVLGQSITNRNETINAMSRAIEYSHEAEVSRNYAENYANGAKAYSENAKQYSEDVRDYVESAKTDIDASVDRAEYFSNVSKGYSVSTKNDANKVYEKIKEASAIVDSANAIKEETEEIKERTADLSNDAYQYSMQAKMEADRAERAMTPATSLTLGIIKPDNVTTFVDTNGMLSSVGGGGGGGIVVDSEFSDSSTNPLQNKVITKRLNATDELINMKFSLQDLDRKTIDVDNIGQIHAVTATSSAVGIVKPDNSTITIDGNGTISVSSDNALSTTSTNPVQNKVVANAIDGCAKKDDLKGYVYCTSDHIYSASSHNLMYVKKSGLTEEYVVVNPTTLASAVYVNASTTLDSLLVGYTNHIQDGDIHVTVNDKSSWNNHVSDSDIHVTVDDKSNWDSKTDTNIVQGMIDSTVGTTYEEISNRMTSPNTCSSAYIVRSGNVRTIEIDGLSAKNDSGANATMQVMTLPVGDRPIIESYGVVISGYTSARHVELRTNGSLCVRVQKAETSSAPFTGKLSITYIVG